MVGFQQFTLKDAPTRPLPVTLWYPTSEQSGAQLIADNVAFHGMEVIKDASSNAQRAPLVLLSHGYRGNWKNLSWLAHRLAQRGYIAAAVEHPGTTTFDQNAAQAAQWWQRPRDVSRALDYLLASNSWSAHIDSDNISAIGHSLGGWTIMQLAGATLDQASFNAHCEVNPNPRTCGLRNELGLNLHPTLPTELSLTALPSTALSSIERSSVETASNAPLITPRADERISRFVSLDLGLARSFSVDSLNAIHQPILILAAGIDIGDLPQQEESGYLAEHLPLDSRQYKVFEHATHFSFFPRCKPNAVALLEQESPGDGMVCVDGEATTRAALHQQIFEDIFAFLDNKQTP
uniref:alpha/beta hydrolase family protein n=1 Tax=Thaumasiovibrio occultus TaxID=1891184 RepID=UPI000B3569B8|nr:alpha/beta fold hydrolase [Thaumasiovibrio occultus]